MKACSIRVHAQTYTPTVQNSATTPPPAKIDAKRAIASSGNGLRDLGSLKTSADKRLGGTSQDRESGSDIRGEGKREDEKGGEGEEGDIREEGCGYRW